MTRSMKRTIRDDLLRTPVVVLRGTAVADRYGHTRIDWTNPTRLDTHGYLHYKTAAERATDRDVQSAEATLFLPPGTDVTGRDRVEVGGHVWGVVGPPERIVPPGSSTEHHIEIELRYVEG
jgi:hypothetical protein